MSATTIRSVIYHPVVPVICTAGGLFYAIAQSNTLAIFGWLSGLAGAVMVALHALEKHSTQTVERSEQE